MSNNLEILENLENIDWSAFSNDEQRHTIEFVCDTIIKLRQCDNDFISRLDNKLLMRVLGTDTYFMRRDSKLRVLFHQMEFLECDLCETENGQLTLTQ